ncbi:MAG: hypothetical protein V4660_02795 [Pseudomonadota bacterium]
MKSSITNVGVIFFIAVLLSACTTSGKFVVPEGSKLYLGDRTTPVNIDSRGIVKTKAFGWEAMGLPPTKGIPYRLVVDGKTTKEGRLRAKLKVSSIFFPPIIGIIAYPTGLNPDITYNLVTGEQK